MVFGLLEWSDFAIIAVLIIIFAGGAAASTRPRPVNTAMLRRIEHKLDLILEQLGIDYVAPEKAVWQELAEDSRQKLAAIKAYREEHGVGLSEAKKAVEDYIEGRG